MEAVQEAAAAALQRLDSGSETAEVFIEDRRVLGLTLGSGGPERRERRLRGACLRHTAGGRSEALHRDDPSPDGLLSAAEALNAGLPPEPDRGPPLSLPAALLPASEEEILRAWLGTVRECLAAVSSDPLLSLTRWRQAVVVARAEAQGANPVTVTDLRDALRVSVSVPGPSAAVRWTLAGLDARDLSMRVAPPRVAEELARRLRAEEEAGPAPVGRFPVVLSPAAAGPLVHEVLGHPLESDAAGSWLVEGRDGLGGLTLVDEPGRCPGAADYRIDDEGVPGRRVVLVREGEVVGRLRDRLSASAAGVEPTGHGRRQSYRDLPAPRLACTVLEPGEARPEELIAEVVRGLYVERVAGGTVDPASGSLCLLAEAARLIEGGRPGAPVRGAVLFGEASSWLGALQGVGSDLSFDHGATDCSKGGQVLPVILGAPTLSFAAVPVGGVGS